MSLGIIINTPFGIALGADSIVSQTQGFLDPESVVELVQLAKTGVEVKSEEFIEVLFKKVKGIVSRQFRTSKIRPLYLKEDNIYWGARIKVGDDTLAHLQDFIIEELDNQKEPMSFQEYVEAILTQLTSRLDEKSAELPNLSANFLYAGYCQQEHKFRVFDVIVAKDDSSKTTSLKTYDRSNNIFAHAGNSEVVDALVAGSSSYMDETVKKHLSLFSLHAILGLDFFDSPERLRDYKVKKAREKLTSLSTSENKEKVGAFLSSNSEYDGRADTLPAPTYLDALLRFVAMPSLMRDLQRGRTISHFQRMSLRELLKVIQFLIETTERFQAYIADEIPTVGGDIYYATITRNEGLVFRNLSDCF